MVRVAPSGSIDRVVEMPCLDITTSTFGGADLKILSVTGAAMLHHPGERLAGSLLAIPCDVPGLLEHPADL